MNPEKFKDIDKKVAGTTKVEIVKIDYLDYNYKIEVFPDNLATSTALVKIAQLIPKNSHLPTFLFRWDKNQNTLDVDIYKEGKLCKELWNDVGYKGHQTQRVSKESKIFDADVSMPDKRIFKGKIDVGLFIKIMIKESAKLTDSVKVVHKKARIGDAGKGTNNIRVNKGN